MGCRSELLEPVEIPQVQFLDKALTMTSCSLLGQRCESRSVLDRARDGLRMRGVLSPLCWESVLVGCRAELLRPVEFPQVQFLDRWLMSMLMLFIDGYGRHCDLAATSGLCWRCLRLSHRQGCGPSVCTETWAFCWAWR